MPANNLPTFKTTYANIKDLLSEGSYLMYEFKDKDVIIRTDNNEVETDSYGNPYHKLISPLFADEVINDYNNQGLLGIITDKTPFYHLESSIPRTADDEEFLSLTRDNGLNFVPAPMQTSFWAVWFRDSQGNIQNNLLLDIYNKLRFPYVNENQYMNADLFPELAQKLYTSESSDNSLIEFKYTQEDNLLDIENGERGCIDYLNDIINQKIQSYYEIIDYNPDQAILLSDWGESLYQSGTLNEDDDVEREKTIFKLQDLRYELIRRKFAGSATLYNLALSSIDRQGSFIGAIPVGRLETVYSVFRDKRYIRIVNIPGILSQYADLTDNDPLKAFYSRPLEDGENYIPLGTVIPLFYTSASQGLYGSYIYDAEDFLLTGYSSGGELIPVEDYRSLFLRDNNSLLVWDNLTGIIAEESINVFYPKLDEKPDGTNYRTMDSDFIASDGTTSEMRLDIEIPFLSMASVVGNFLDISANHLLYHENTIQQALGDSYPYLTYPIASGNSVSLMDIQWVNYLQNSTERKSRVQDQVLFGSQVNRYASFTNAQNAEHIFFGISYGDGSESFDYSDFVGFKNFDEVENIKYAYLWYVTVSYDILEFKVNKISPILISKISLKPEEDLTYAEQELGNLDIFQDYKNYNIGILPITYTEMYNDALINAFRFGIEEVDDHLEFVDTLSELGYTKAYYIFSDSDVSFSDINFQGYNPTIGLDPKNVDSAFSESTTLGKYNTLKSKPDAETKAVYFCIPRSEYSADSTSKSENDVVIKYYWSEPFRVVPLSDQFLSNLMDKVLSPDWYELNFHINPYLNFTKNSASALNHKEVLLADTIQSLGLSQDVIDGMSEGPGQYAALSSLSRTRGYDFTCNDSGEIKDTDKPYGFYLQRICPNPSDPNFSQRQREYVKIYGDNRHSDAYDITSIESTVQNRSEVNQDDHEVYCIEFEEGNQNDSVIGNYVDISNNYFQICPINFSKYTINGDIIEGSNQTLSDIYDNWYWNEPNNGITIFTNILFDSVDVIGNANISINDDVYSVESINSVEDILIAQRRGEEGTVSSEFSLKYVNELIDNTIRSYFKFEYYPVGDSAQPIYIRSDYTETSFELDQWEILGTGNETENRRVRLLIDNILTKFNTRLGASVKVSSDVGINTVDLSLVINNHIYTKTYTISKGENNTFIVETDTPNENEITTIDNSVGFKYRDNATYLNIGDSFVPGYPAKYYKGSNLGNIDIFSNHKEEDGKTIQYEMFTGKLYDFRLYNTGMDSYGLQFHNIGLMREQYSYAPSSYKLAYSVYNDFGIFKPVKGIPISAGNISEINRIRIFDRTVWDSILVDMYCVSTDEMEPSAPQYDPRFRDPLTDTDIYDKEGNLVCIEQALVESSEVTNNRHPNTIAGSNNIRVQYKGEIYNIDYNDWTTIITTSLYPVDYKNTLFASNCNLSTEVRDGYILLYTPEPDPSELNPDNTGITLPVIQSGNTLKYSTELSLNFEIENQSDLSVFYSRGNNIELIYNPSLDQSTIRLKDTTRRSSTDNHVLLSFTIPSREEIGSQDSIYIDRFYLKGIQLNNGLQAFLKATSYYTEFRLPIAFQESVGSEPKYLSKWDGIRCLKEGTYYFTVKYPLEIIPFIDYEYNTLAKGKFAPLYGSARFKVEVKGTPKEYISDNYLIEGYPSQYHFNNIKNTLSSGGSLWDPDDNRTFPHREIYIDLYVMDSNDTVGLMSNDNEEMYGFGWKKIASNYQDEIVDDFSKIEFVEETITDENGPILDEDGNQQTTIVQQKVARKLIVLNKETLNESLVIKDEEIPLFLSKNYTSPFFIAKYEKGSNESNPLSADDDTIEPIWVSPLYNDYGLERENLNIISENDLDKLSLVSGKSYKLLFDYDAQLTELSFTDKIYTETSITESEKLNYTRLVNLLDTDSSVSDYIYDGAVGWFNRSNYNFSSKTSGFETTEGSWVEKNTSLDNNIVYFGNPYSRASEYNYLLDIEKDNRDQIDNLAYFPYVCDDHEEYIVPAQYFTTVPAIDNRGSAVAYVVRSRDIGESKLLADNWQALKGKVISAINQIKSNVSGLFTNLSYIAPNIRYSMANNETPPESSTIIKADEYDLFGYYASDRTIPSRNDNIIISRRGVYSNNLIKNKNFLNSSYWSLSTGGTFESDTGWDHGIGKDVFKFPYINEIPEKSIKVRYLSGSRIIKSTYEVAINAMIRNFNSPYNDYKDSLSIKANFYLNTKKVAEVELTDIVESQREGEVLAYEIPNPDAVSWWNYSKETTSSIEADSVEFEFTFNNISDDVDLFITKPVVRRSSMSSHRLGLSDALYNISTTDEYSKVSCVAHRIVFFRNKETLQPVPIQFKNNIRSYSSSRTNLSRNSYAESGQSRVVDFIKSCSLGKSKESSKLEILFKPWERRLVFWDKKELSMNKTVDNFVQFYGYIPSEDSLGVKKKVLSKIPTTDIFSTNKTDLLGQPVDNPFVYDATTNQIKINGMALKTTGGLLAGYNTNLSIYLSDPVELLDERFSCISNCFNPDRYKQRQSNPVAITNIQLLGDYDIAAGTKEIIYELEYLPVIYDELDQHISINILLHKQI